MNLGPDLWRNLDGTVVVSTLVPTGIPGTYDIIHRPADEEDLLTYSFLKPEHEQETDPQFE